MPLTGSTDCYSRIESCAFISENTGYTCWILKTEKGPEIKKIENCYPKAPINRSEYPKYPVLVHGKINPFAVNLSPNLDHAYWINMNFRNI